MQHAEKNYFGDFELFNMQSPLLDKRLHAKYSPEEQRERYATTKAIFRHSEEEQEEIYKRLEEESMEFNTVGKIWNTFYEGVKLEDENICTETCSYYTTLNLKWWGVPGAKYPKGFSDIVMGVSESIADVLDKKSEEKYTDEELEDIAILKEEIDWLLERHPYLKETQIDS